MKENEYKSQFGIESENEEKVKSPLSMRLISENEYKSQFGIEPEDEEKVKKALEHALDIRKFEIGLYWKRAAYFWALIAAAFAGYFAILSSEKLQNKEYLAYIVGCIGLIFTWAWFLVNRGSKYWQENWENHVDMLEDQVTGPLYKTILHRRPPEKGTFEKHVTDPLAISVSKINQLVSLFTLCIWVVLIFHTLLGRIINCTLSFGHFVVGGITVLFIMVMKWKGKTSMVTYEHIAEMRDTKIV